MRLAGLRIVSGYFRLQVSSCKEFRTSSCLIWSIKTLTEKVGLLRKLRRSCTRNVREECVAWLPPFTCGGETLELLGPNWWSFGIWSTCYPRIPILYRFAPSLHLRFALWAAWRSKRGCQPNKNQFNRCCNSSGAWSTQWTAHHGKVITVRLATADPQRSVSDQKISKRFAQTFQIWRLGALYHICLWERSTLSHMLMKMIK